VKKSTTSQLVITKVIFRPYLEGMAVIPGGYSS